VVWWSPAAWKREAGERESEGVRKFRVGGRAGLWAARNRRCGMVLGMVLHLQFECWAANRRSTHQNHRPSEVNEPTQQICLGQVQFFGATSSVLRVCHREHQVELILL
jgi:hypothetical protein